MEIELLFGTVTRYVGRQDGRKPHAPSINAQLDAWRVVRICMAGRSVQQRERCLLASTRDGQRQDGDQNWETLPVNILIGEGKKLQASERCGGSAV